MRPMLRCVYARLFGLNLAFLQTCSRRIVATDSARKMSTYSTVERGSRFSLDYRVYLSKFQRGPCPVVNTERYRKQNGKHRKVPKSSPVKDVIYSGPLVATMIYFVILLFVT